MESQIRIVYGLDHECLCCGCSCMSQLVGPLSDAEHQNILNAHRDLSNAGCVQATLNPIMKGLKPDGSCLYFLNFPGKKCFFLGEDNLCHIHGKLGAEQKPAACRRFPRIGISTGNEIRVGIKPYCYGLYGHFDTSPVGDDYLNRFRSKEENWVILKDLVDTASYRPVIRSNDQEELDNAQKQENEILAYLQNVGSYASIMAYLLTGEPCERTVLSDAFLQLLHEMMVSVKPQLMAEAEKLGQTVHANHVRHLCALLDKPIQFSEALALDKPFGSYARYALHQVVFLRETTRFPMVSLGAFAFGLGALIAAQDMDHAGEHLTAWMRLMAQTQLFMMLFPSPNVMMQLAEVL